MQKWIGRVLFGALLVLPACQGDKSGDASSRQSLGPGSEDSPGNATAEAQPYIPDFPPCPYATDTNGSPKAGRTEPGQPPCVPTSPQPEQACAFGYVTSQEEPVSFGSPTCIDSTWRSWGEGPCLTHEELTARADCGKGKDFQFAGIKFKDECDATHARKAIVLCCQP
jgi:hypothetical protein